MIKLEQLKVSISDEKNIVAIIAKKLKLDASKIKDYQIIKRSIDARKKPDIYYVYTIAVELSTLDEKKLLSTGVAAIVLYGFHANQPPIHFLEAYQQRQNSTSSRL